MSSSVPSFATRSGTLLFPEKFHLWLAGVLLCIGACLVNFYFVFAGVPNISETTRMVGGLIGIGIFTYMIAGLAGFVFWRGVQMRLGFSVYWAAMTGLGGGLMFGPIYGLGVAAIMLIGLYSMEHLLMRPGFIGGIFDGAYSGFGVAFSIIILSIAISLPVYKMAMHPKVLGGVCIFVVGIRMLGKRYIHFTDKKLKRREAQSCGYKISFPVVQSLVFIGIAMLLFLDSAYFIPGVLFSALHLIIELLPSVRQPIEIERPSSDIDIIE